MHRRIEEGYCQNYRNEWVIKIIYPVVQVIISMFYSISERSFVRNLTAYSYDMHVKIQQPLFHFPCNFKVNDMVVAISRHGFFVPPIATSPYSLTFFFEPVPWKISFAVPGVLQACQDG